MLAFASIAMIAVKRFSSKKMNVPVNVILPERSSDEPGTGAPRRPQLGVVGYSYPGCIAFSHGRKYYRLKEYEALLEELVTVMIGDEQLSEGLSGEVGTHVLG